LVSTLFLEIEQMANILKKLQADLRAARVTKAMAEAVQDEACYAAACAEIKYLTQKIKDSKHA
jgi:hypothetical protein